LLTTPNLIPVFYERQQPNKTSNFAGKSRKLDPQRQQTHKLATLCERYGIDLTHAHDALHDATATAQLLPHLLRGNGVSDAEGIQPFLLP
jgi:DNA polymerase III epsilon subunit-like protein